MKRKRSKSSRAWLHEHETDPYVQQARKEGYRSRAIFKLQEIDEKDKLFRPGMAVLDLGAAPGGWSEYAIQKVQPKGRVIALDLLPMKPIEGVDFIQGDFNEEAVFEALLARVHDIPIDIVLCDIAPNMTGFSVVDQAQSMQLAELAFDFAAKVLKPQGTFLVKNFEGSGSQEFRTLLKTHFEKVMTRKPQASRARSAEFYLLAKGFNQ